MLEDKAAIDAHMARLDTQGLSRRDFLSFLSGAVALTGASAIAGAPGRARAATNGKLVYLAPIVNEYNEGFNRSLQAASKAFGFSSVLLNSNFDGGKQLSQFEQQAVAGVNGVILNMSDGGGIRRIAQDATNDGIYIANVWDSLPWFTPFEASDYYTLYAMPDEYISHYKLTTLLLDKVTKTFGGGDIIAVTGNNGNALDIQRNNARDRAFANFPKTRLVGHLPGEWSHEKSMAATEELLARHKNVVGVVAQSDDEAQGVLAALKANGLTPGKDVFVVSADGTGVGAQAVKRGEQLATGANSPAFAAAMFTARLYDVLNGWRPKAAERLLNWDVLIVTQSNVDAYLRRFIDYTTVEPFDYRRMSKVAHPQDWDPQNDVYPMDIDRNWSGIPKPAGWSYPKAYLEAKQTEFAAVTAEYRAHYKLPIDGPAPKAT